MFLYQRACNLTKIRKFESCLLMGSTVLNGSRRLSMNGRHCALRLNGVKYVVAHNCVIHGIFVSYHSVCVILSGTCVESGPTGQFSDCHISQKHNTLYLLF